MQLPIMQDMETIIATIVIVVPLLPISALAIVIVIVIVSEELVVIPHLQVSPGMVKILLSTIAVKITTTVVIAARIIVDMALLLRAL